MDDEICTVSLGNGVLDNDYTFYQSGKIKHFYDRNSFRLNIEDWVSATQIDHNTKARILEKCPIEFKNQVESILL